MIPRPKCSRCGGPLDLWHDPETGIGFICNNPWPLTTDEEYAERWNSLDGDDVAKLERAHYGAPAERG